jgi:hypothetical protein
MANYRFNQFNIDIINPTIEKHGHAGGMFLDNISQGGFYCDIKLITDSATFAVRLESQDSQPLYFSIEEIDVWIENELANYEI